MLTATHIETEFFQQDDVFRYWFELNDGRQFAVVEGGMFSGSIITETGDDVYDRGLEEILRGILIVTDEMRMDALSIA